ncbi:MAG: hypothetical protein ACI4WU_03645 [Bacilli bacterium]
MIIKLLLELIMGLINLIPFNIPSLPDNFSSFIEQFKTIIQGGVNFVSTILPYDYIIVLLEIFLGIEAAFHVYKFVMWVIRKIPMANIKD